MCRVNKWFSRKNNAPYTNKNGNSYNTQFYSLTSFFYKIKNRLTHLNLTVKNKINTKCC